MREDIHKIPEDDFFKSLNTKKRGLSDAEAKFRLIKNGLNTIESGKKKSQLSIFLSNFNSPLVSILFIASLIALYLENYIDAFVIFIVILVNAIIGYFQEAKAEKTIEELKKISTVKTVVIRDGKKKKIPSSEIVIGDVLYLSEGSKIPADARVVFASGLQLNESSLTGESIFVDKCTKPGLKKGERNTRNIVYMGTTVISGHGEAVVYATGQDTEFGKIGKIVEDEFHSKTPLQIKLEKFGKQIGFLVIAICFVVYIIGTLSGIDPLLMFETAVSLAVSAIPEGLPVAITVILVLGMKRMAKKKAIIRKLSAVETLGTTTVIASDKTGTLTHNKLTITEIFAEDKYSITGEGYGVSGDYVKNGLKTNPSNEVINLLSAAVLASNGEIKRTKSKTEVFGDPVDSAILVAAEKASINYKKLFLSQPRLGEIPFSSDKKMAASLNKSVKNNKIYIKGAFEEVIKISNSFLGKKLTTKKRNNLIEIANEMAERGLRVLAVAENKCSIKDISDRDLNGGFNLIGFMGMKDTYRIGAKHAISIAKRAGIDVLMLTGDHLNTARNIGHDLSIISREDEALDVSELQEETRSKINILIEKTKVFARIKPKAKYEIIEALKNRGEIVAMTGDGVNDVPALKKADIGIAMGISGTDAAKEAADMVLTDDNFATIVHAVEEGRTIFENIRKALYYLFSTNAGEIMVVLGGLILSYPLILMPVQILWMNLITDTPTVLPLGMEPTDEDHLKKPPRSPKESIISRIIVFRTFLVGFTMAVIGLWLFKSLLPQGEDYARTMTFTFLVVSQWVNAFNAKSETKSIFKMDLLNNMWLIWGTVISIVLQLVINYVEPLNSVFGLVCISWQDWLYVTALSLSVLIVIEIAKIFTRLRIKKSFS